VKTIIVGQAWRNDVRAALAEGGVTVVRSGYADSSTTTWRFDVRTRKSASALQELVWAIGCPSVTVRAGR
jgi:hypothetical protein